MNFTSMTTVSPSPRDLVARLSGEEGVAIDLLLQGGDAKDPRLLALVPDVKRRGYLGTLAVQLRALGFTLSESPALDASVRGWYRAQEAATAREAIRRHAVATEAEALRRRDEALPPAARRAVQRRRRRLERRQRGAR